MNGENHKINIKRDSLDMPVFLKSQSRGTVLLSEPLSCTSFTPYLSRVAVLLGYPPESSHFPAIYAFMGKVEYSGEILGRFLILMSSMAPFSNPWCCEGSIRSSSLTLQQETTVSP
jgi:hypothetical protein